MKKNKEASVFFLGKNYAIHPFGTFGEKRLFREKGSQKNSLNSENQNSARGRDVRAKCSVISVSHWVTESCEWRDKKLLKCNSAFILAP